MSYVRELDPSMNVRVRKEVAEQAVSVVCDFCKAARHRRAMQRLEDAFNHSLRSWADSVMFNYDRGASSNWKELLRLVDKAKVISDEAEKREMIMSPKFPETVKPSLVDLNVSIDEKLFNLVEAMSLKLGVTRRAFVEKAVREELKKSRG